MSSIFSRTERSVKAAPPVGDAKGFVAFSFRVAWAKDYAHLFRDEVCDVTDADQLFRIATDVGRTIISANGGSGKTSIANRTVELATAHNIRTFLIDMKKWSPAIQENWENGTGDVLARADFLLTKLCQPEASLAAIDALPPNVPKLVIIDGLNEIRSSLGQEIIASADKMASAYPGLSVLIMDRLARRSMMEARWKLGTVLPLEEQVIQKALAQRFGDDPWRTASGSQKQLLESPFFLDKTLQDGSLAATTSEAVWRYLLTHSGLQEVQIEAAARGAFGAYEGGRGGRTFSLVEFEEAAGRDVTEALRNAGILMTQGNEAYFQHHLFHDVLAARFVAKHRELWSDDILDALTFRASAFDAIAKVLEQLAPQNADDFIRKVFDWNPYAAAYAISDAQTATEIGVSPPMRVVMAASLAERLWDPVEATAQRSADALGLLGSAEARTFLQASDLAAAIRVASSFRFDDRWFVDWQRLYTKQPMSPAADHEVELLSSEDSIAGWTVAGVLRRSQLNQHQLARVREMAHDPAASQAVRWRAVHVLGAFPNTQNKDELVERLSHENAAWVRYGTLRSLMEMAARSPELRESILRAVLEKIDVVLGEPRLLEEFSRTALAKVTADRQTWRRGIGGILRVLADRAQTPQDLERWVRLGQEIEAKDAA
jgi:HEAT repeat protein